MKTLLPPFALFLSIMLFTNCNKDNELIEKCIDELKSDNLPTNIDKVIIKSGNGNIFISNGSSNKYFYPGGWIKDKGYNTYSVSGTTMYIDETFSDSYIQLTNLNSIEILDQNSTATLSPSLIKNNFDFSIKGNATITIDYVCGETEENILAKSTAVHNATIVIHNNGTFDGYKAHFKEVISTLNANGTAKIKVQDHLNVSIPSNGTVYYKGTPTIIQNVSNMGELINDN